MLSGQELEELKRYKELYLQQKKEIEELKEEIEQRKMAFDFLQSKIKGLQ